MEDWDERGEPAPQVYDFVPAEVLGGQADYVRTEPRWGRLPQMSYMEFYQVGGVCVGGWVRVLVGL